MTGDAAPARVAPDFARLYADAGSPLSPRMASRLCGYSIMLADTYASGTCSSGPCRRSRDAWPTRCGWSASSPALMPWPAVSSDGM